MIAASTQFLDQFLSEGSAVGIVEFESDAEILSDMTMINGPEDRNFLKHNLPDNANGGTGIGCGILRAIEVN